MFDLAPSQTFFAPGPFVGLFACTEDRHVVFTQVGPGSVG
jgi:hypothetical protein